MALVVCEISNGLRESEVTVSVKDVNGDQQFLRVEKDFLTFDSGRNYLTIGIIQKDRSGRSVLVELPQEADSGTFRLWVALEDLKMTGKMEAVS